MKVRDIMTKHAEWIDADTPLKDVAKKMRDKNIGCLPVGENDRLIGMITDRDIACRAVADARDPVSTKARDVMTKGIAFCFDDQTDEDAAEMMEGKKIHHLPVLNREKRLVGVLSLGDLALRSSKALSAELIHLVSRDAERHQGRARAS